MEKTKKLTLNLKNGTFIPFFINAARRRMPIWIVSNQSLRNIMSYYHGYKKLGRKYREVLARFPENERRNREIPPVIWVFWHQGLEKAPDLVKVCFRSVCKYMTGYEIHFLDAENMLQFVEIPNGKVEAWHHFARTFFGLFASVPADKAWWNVDRFYSALYRQGRFRRNQQWGGLFVYKDRQGVKRGSVMSSWLIAANRESNILRCLKYLLDVYWQEYNYPIDYFLIHILFALSVERFSDEWRAVPTFTNDVPHILSSEIAEPYTKKRYSQIRGMSNIHKLSRRGQESDMPAGSFYDVLIRNGMAYSDTD